MRKTYAAPRLIDHGHIAKLTLGQHGSLPDFNVNGQVVANDNCNPADDGPGNSGNSNPFVCLAASTL